jgi:hypothetical protein
MHQKDLARQAWQAAGFYRSPDAKLLRFLKHFDQSAADCWPDMVDECRARYPEYKERLVVPLWNTGDRLLRLNLIRVADFRFADELELALKYVQQSRPDAELPELRALIQKGHERVWRAIDRKRNLPPDLRTFLDLHRPKDLERGPGEGDR